MRDKRSRVAVYITLDVMNEYRITYDEAFVISSLSHFRRQREVYPWFIALKVLCGLGLSGLLVILIGAVLSAKYPNSSGLLLVALVPALFLLLLVLGPRIDYALTRRRLKKSAFYGDSMQIQVNALGIAVTSPRSELKLSWSVFTKARRIASGFMVHSDGSIHWWPDSALSAGSIGDVERLLRENVRSYVAK